MAAMPSSLLPNPGSITRVAPKSNPIPIIGESVTNASPQSYGPIVRSGGEVSRMRGVASGAAGGVRPVTRYGTVSPLNPRSWSRHDMTRSNVASTPRLNRMSDPTLASVSPATATPLTSATTSGRKEM